MCTALFGGVACCSSVFVIKKLNPVLCSLFKQSINKLKKFQECKLCLFTVLIVAMIFCNHNFLFAEIKASIFL